MFYGISEKWEKRKGDQTENYFLRDVGVRAARSAVNNGYDRQQSDNDQNPFIG
jgi:hypothetical protein